LTGDWTEPGRIEPTHIAAESDPSARLTIGQDITPQLEVIYSANLTDSGDQIYVGSTIGRRFGQVVHETDPENQRGEDLGSLFRFEFRHDLRLGGGPNSGEPRSQQRREKREVRAVRFSGDFAGISEEKLTERFDVEAGDTYSFFEVNRGMDRLREYLMEQGHLEARVRLSRRDISGGALVELDLQVVAGPKVSFVFNGAEVPGDIQEDVREVWTTGVFDAQRAQDSIELIRDSLLDRGYLEAKVDWQATPSGSLKTVTFNISRGALRNVESIPRPGR
jgi:hypothetical protein